MTHHNQTDRIEQYHSGDMSPEEIKLFENDLTADPTLKAESDLQGDIINGLKEYRKSQLKSRLDAVNVSPGWFEFAQQSALVKSFGGIAVATLIGTGVYLGADKKEIEENTTGKFATTAATVPELQRLEFEWAIPEVESKEEVIAQKLVLSSSEEEKDIVTAEQASVAKEDAVAEQAEAFVPQFVAPVVNDFEESEIKTSELEKIASENNPKEELEPIEVETKNSRSSKIRYKYYDGKLFLNGNFNKEPYEILEINSANGRRIYLLHQNKYYEVKITDQLTDLPEVRNIKLIQELRLIKENK